MRLSSLYGLLASSPVMGDVRQRLLSVLSDPERTLFLESLQVIRSALAQDADLDECVPVISNLRKLTRIIYESDESGLMLFLMTGSLCDFFILTDSAPVESADSPN